MDGNPELLALTFGCAPFHNKTRHSKIEGERRVENVSGSLRCTVGIEAAVRKHSAVLIDLFPLPFA